MNFMKKPLLLVVGIFLFGTSYLFSEEHEKQQQRFRRKNLPGDICPTFSKFAAEALGEGAVYCCSGIGCCCLRVVQPTVSKATMCCFCLFAYPQYEAYLKSQGDRPACCRLLVRKNEVDL